MGKSTLHNYFASKDENYYGGKYKGKHKYAGRRRGKSLRFFSDGRLSGEVNGVQYDFERQIHALVDNEASYDDIMAAIGQNNGNIVKQVLKQFFAERFRM